MALVEWQLRARIEMPLTFVRTQITEDPPYEQNPSQQYVVCFTQGRYLNEKKNLITFI